MKKYLLSFGLVVAFAFYALLSNNSGSTSVVATPTSAPATSGSGAATAITQPTTGTSAPKDDGGGGDDRWQRKIRRRRPRQRPQRPRRAAQRVRIKTAHTPAPVTDAYFGSVQVAAVIQNGALANVQVLQYPSDQGTSKRISGTAMPKLIQEAIQTQSANIDIVSGATQTSQAFSQSLAAALAIAK